VRLTLTRLTGIVLRALRCGRLTGFLSLSVRGRGVLGSRDYPFGGKV
jgi:hypothetical protein